MAHNGQVAALGLQDDEPLLVASSAAPCHLCHKLVGALVAAEVGVVEHGVGVHDADDAHVGKVESLAHHLRADEDVRSPLGKIVEDALVGVAGVGGVEVHAVDARFRDEAVQFLFDALCAQADVAQALLATGRARQGDAVGVAAVVADKLSEASVVSERDVATLAAGHPSAGRALQHGGIAAPVLKENSLLAPCEGFADGAQQTRGEGAAHAAFAIELADIDNLYLGHLHGAPALV